MSLRVPGALLVLLAAAAHIEAAGAAAQEAPHQPDPARPVFWWASGAAVLVAALADEDAEEASLSHRSSTLDRLAGAGNTLGAGKYLVPALGASYLAGRLLHRPRVADAALHGAAAYALGNVVASLGKPLVGRHRPDTLGSPWRFHPLARGGEWHALPSAHTLHVFTLAGAIAEEAGNPWVTATAYGAAMLVGWSRVYADEHWASDVALSAVAGAAIGHLTVRLLHAVKSTAPPRSPPNWGHRRTAPCSPGTGACAQPCCR